MKLQVEFDIDLGDPRPLTPRKWIAYVKRVIRENAEIAEWAISNLRVKVRDDDEKPDSQAN